MLIVDSLVSLATPPGLTRLQLTPRTSERDVFLFLLLKKDRHLDMMIGDLNQMGPNHRVRSCY